MWNPCPVEKKNTAGKSGNSACSAGPQHAPLALPKAAHRADHLLGLMSSRWWSVTIMNYIWCFSNNHSNNQSINILIYIYIYLDTYVYTYIYKPSYIRTIIIMVYWLLASSSRWKIGKSVLGWLFPIYGMIIPKNVPNLQPAIINHYVLVIAIVIVSYCIVIVIVLTVCVRFILEFCLVTIGHHVESWMNHSNE